MKHLNIKQNFFRANNFFLVYNACVMFMVNEEWFCKAIFAGWIYFAYRVVLSVICGYYKDYKNGKKRKEMANRADGASTDVDGSVC